MSFLYDMTLYITVTAVILLIFKAVFRNKLSARGQMYLWLVLAVRLVFPTLPQSEISVYNAIGTPSYEYRSDVSYQTAAYEVQKPQDIEEPLRKSFDVQKLVHHLWLCGMSVFLAYFAIAYIIFSSRVRKYPAIFEEKLYECKELLGIKRNIAVLTGGEGPMLSGVIRPVLIMPEGYSEEERRDIIIHELCHLKNNDILILWAGLFVVCINWFNPVIWYAFSVLRRDVEVYCDQRVLEFTKNKKSYAGLLLKATLKKNNFIAGTTAAGGSRKDVERRIRHIAYFKKPGFLWSAVVGIISVLIASACLTDSYTDCSMKEEVFLEYTGNIVGSEMADIDYADSEKIIFHYGFGLYSYSLKDKRIAKAYDLAMLSENINSGKFVDFAVTVSSDGDEALITTPEMSNSGRGEVGNYIIKLDGARAKETNKIQIRNPYKNSANFTETAQTLPEVTGWTSYGCLKEDDKYYCLTLDNGFEIRDIKVIEADMKGNILNEYFPFTPERIFVEGKGFGFWAPDKNVIKGDYPERIEDGQIGFAQNVKINDFRKLKGINNHSENTATKSIYGYRNKIYQAIETYTKPAASGGEERESLTMYFFGYPTKTDEYAVIYFNSGTVAEADVNYMLSSFRFYVSELYEETKEYLMAKFFDKYSPIYEILDLYISGWEQKGDEAVFSYTMIEKNYDKDPDTVEYIKKAKEEGSKLYETYKKEYLMPRDSNYHYMVRKTEGQLEIKTNIGHKGEVWVEVDFDE